MELETLHLEWAEPIVAAVAVAVAIAAGAVVVVAMVVLLGLAGQMLGEHCPSVVVTGAGVVESLLLHSVGLVAGSECIPEAKVRLAAEMHFVPA